MRSGPLAGVKILEVGGIGPNPFAAMLLADMGADVLRVDRPGARGPLGEGASTVVNRGRPTLPLDFKLDSDRETLLRLAEKADALIEGFRPGVMERLGFGPDELLERNPRLVYGRMTGWGQDGPMASVAGHDINYISIAGALGAMARRGERPLFPLNLAGDYGGGAMFLAFGVVCGLLEARSSGKGQVIDAAMVDGASVLMSVFHGLASDGSWRDPPGTNVLDSGAHFYEVYETSDGGYISVGAIEPQFYAELLRLLEVDPDEAPQWDQERWPELKDRFAEIFRGRTRDAWAELLAGAEACATPVLGLHEAPEHPHNVARGNYVEAAGIVQPAPAPRFSRTPPDAVPQTPELEQVLSDWGLSGAEPAALDAAEDLSEEPLHAEDFEVGRRFELGSHPISAEDIKSFARAWDPLPFHVDEEAAADSPFGGLVASGAHTLAICIRLASDAVVSRTAVIAGRGIGEARFLRPVRPGAELSGTTTVIEQRLEDERRGAIVIRNELCDQQGELVMWMTGELLVRRRSAPQDP